jgi:hypothetical protein
MTATQLLAWIAAAVLLQLAAGVAWSLRRRGAGVADKRPVASPAAALSRFARRVEGPMQVNGLPADIAQRLPGIGRTAGTQLGVSERSLLAGLSQLIWRSKPAV